MMSFFFLSILFIFTQTEKTKNAGPELIQAIFVSRHGIRASVNPIPNYFCKEFKKMPGQITSTGMYQNFRVGQLLAEDYADLLNSSTYNPKKHRFIATGDDKTLSSGQNLFQGIFNKTFKEQTEPFPVCKAVPVFANTASIDHVMMSETTCIKKLNQLRAYLLNTTEWIQKQKDNEAFLKYVTENGGFSSIVNLSLNTVPRAAEQVILAQGHINASGNDPKVKELLADCLYNTTGEYKDINERLVDLATWRNQKRSNPEDREIAKLVASPFILNAITEMQKRMNDNGNSWDFIFFSGSNPNVMGLLQLFGQPSPGRVPFGSFIYFDLYKTNDSKSKSDVLGESDVAIKFGYRIYDAIEKTLTNKADADLTQKVFKKEYCTISDLKGLVYSMDEWMKECGLVEETTDEPDTSKNDDDDDLWFIIGIAILGCVCLGLIIALVLVCCLCRGGSSRSSRDKFDSNYNTSSVEMDEQNTKDEQESTSTNPDQSNSN